MGMQEYIFTALADKTVIFVTHQVEFLPAADLILVCEVSLHSALYICTYTFIHMYVLEVSQCHYFLYELHLQ